VIHHDHQPPQQTVTATSEPLLERRDVAVLVPAAGQGVRLGAGVPKALHDLAGQSLLTHCLRGLLASPSVGLVVIAAPAAFTDVVREQAPAAFIQPIHEQAPALFVQPVTEQAPEATGAGGSSPTFTAEESTGRPTPSPASGESGGSPAPRLVVVEGGSTRQESVSRALAAVPAEFGIILVHDAARALTPPTLIERVAAAVRTGHDAVIPVLPVVDTIKQLAPDGHVLTTVDRSLLGAVQTPQGFRRELLIKAHASAADAHTDDAGLVERLGLPVFTVPGDVEALKVTTPFDLVIAEAILRGRADSSAA
jgi:2-C-methyl-D-erythritol 4-phosphate cytidylyltransferase